MNRKFQRVLSVAVGLGIGWVGQVCADWPQWLGPDRNGVVPGKAPKPWPTAGPAIAWKAEVGSGFSGPIIVGDLVLLHHRVADEEVLEAFDRSTGKSRWKSSQPTAYNDDFGFDNGPRGTPSAVEGMAYTFGAEGRLTAVNLTNGLPVWSLALGRELGADKGFFGFACSPLVVSNRVIIHVGGEGGAGVVAVNAKTGAREWQSTSDEAGYSSPVAALVGGKQRIVSFTRAGLKLLEIDTGKVVGEFPWRSRQNASVNAATPLVGPAGIFITTSYNTGAALLRWQAAGGLEPVWSGDEAISAHVATPVLKGAWIFGFHGRQEQGAELRCIEAATGTVKWEAGRTGMGSVLVVEDTLIVLLESGELVLAEATADSWKPLCRAQILGTGVRAAPAVDGGLLVARDRSRLVAVRISP